MQFAENIDYDLSQLSAGGAAGSDHIDPAKLPLRLTGSECEPTYPHQYLNVNTIMEVIYAAGKCAAWLDKHPAYEIVGGPSGKGLEDLYTPEINSTTVPNHRSADWTTDPSYTRVYDSFKVTGILNQIKGLDHTGAKHVGVPTIFGVNFQAVSVGQKVTADGNLDAAGTPSAELALSNLSASGGVTIAQETADNVALIWLTKQDQLPAALALLQADQAHANHLRIQKIYAGAELKAKFGDPARGRSPDIIVQPIPGTIYSASKRKISEHGGFADDDTHVLLLVANPGLRRREINLPVMNAQVAPTLLRALGLEPRKLEAVRLEGTRVLPGVQGDD